MPKAPTFKQIATSCNDADTVLYALDARGRVWYFNWDHDEWRRISDLAED
jgi:hypothetical protein